VDDFIESSLVSRVVSTRYVGFAYRAAVANFGAWLSRPQFAFIGVHSWLSFSLLQFHDELQTRSSQSLGKTAVD
jgi:hypothetical protein